MNKKEIAEIIENDNDASELFKKADEIRKEYVGDYIHIRGLIEFSNICRCNCLYCGIRCDNDKLERYRMNKDEILNACENAKMLGYKTVVLQSGEDVHFTSKILGDIIREIKEKYQFAITLSIGERTKDEYRELKEAGADRFLLRIETTDSEVYKKMHPGCELKERINCLYALKELGYEVGTGSLVGLPGQSPQSLADDILFFKSIDADMIGIGPLIPHPNTPLSAAKKGDFYTALKVMALCRIILKDINIPATTAMETLMKGGRKIALQSGANVVMPNINLFENKKKYQIYPDKAGTYDDMYKNDENTRNLIKSLNRKVGSDKGFRKKAI